MNDNIEKYISNVAEWLKITKGEEGLKMLLNEGSLKQAMHEYNEAFAKFANEFKNTNIEIREPIINQMGCDVYFRLRRLKLKEMHIKNSLNILNGF